VSIPNTSEKSNDLDRQENLTKGNVSAKKVVLYTYDSGSDTLQPYAGTANGSSTTWSVNDISDGATSYFGKTTPDGQWQIVKVTDTSVSYATVSNNGAVTSYTDAWTNKATLTYGRFDEAF